MNFSTCVPGYYPISDNIETFCQFCQSVTKTRIHLPETPSCHISYPSIHTGSPMSSSPNHSPSVQNQLLTAKKTLEPIWNCQFPRSLSLFLYSKLKRHPRNTDAIRWTGWREGMSYSSEIKRCKTRNWSPKRLLKVCSENKLLSYFIFVLFWSDVHQPILDICCIALVEEPEEAIPFSFICNKFWKIADQFKVAFGFCKNTREIKSSIIVLKPHLMTLLEAKYSKCSR